VKESQKPAEFYYNYCELEKGIETAWTYYSLTKGGQIVGLANIKGDWRLSLKEIAAITKISVSTCSDIIRFSVLRMSETHILDPCLEENLRPRPTAINGSN